MQLICPNNQIWILLSNQSKFPLWYFKLYGTHIYLHTSLTKDWTAMSYIFANQTNALCSWQYMSSSDQLVSHAVELMNTYNPHSYMISNLMVLYYNWWHWPGKSGPNLGYTWLLVLKKLPQGLLLLEWTLDDTVVAMKVRVYIICSSKLGWTILIFWYTIIVK